MTVSGRKFQRKLGGFSRTPGVLCGQFAKLLGCCLRSETARTGLAVQVFGSGFPCWCGGFGVGWVGLRESRRESPENANTRVMASDGFGWLVRAPIVTTSRGFR
jgi:hypothetical protein